MVPGTTTEYERGTGINWECLCHFGWRLAVPKPLAQDNEEQPPPCAFKICSITASFRQYVAAVILTLILFSSWGSKIWEIQRVNCSLSYQGLMKSWYSHSVLGGFGITFTSSHFVSHSLWTRLNPTTRSPTVCFGAYEHKQTSALPTDISVRFLLRLCLVSGRVWKHFGYHTEIFSITNI